MHVLPISHKKDARRAGLWGHGAEHSGLVGRMLRLGIEGLPVLASSLAESLLCP